MTTIPRTLLAFLLLCGAAWGQVVQTQPGVPSSYLTVANVKSGCGSTAAAGDGTTDDSPAFKACINLAITNAAAGKPTAVYAPGGQYLIKSQQLPIMTRGVGIIGDGQHKTYIKIDPTYVGTLFGWSEAWFANDYGGPTLTIANDKAGAFVHDLTVVGNTSAGSEQDAFVFSDRNDHVEFHNVSVFFLVGQCLSIGTVLNQTQAYVRESVFDNFFCWYGGTASKPAVEVSTTAVNGSDSTNEIRFNRLDIFNAAGTGLSVHTPTAFASTRLIEFYSPRIEQSAGDNVQIGAAGDLALTNSIRMYGLQSLAPGGANNGFYGLNIGLGATQDYDIQVLGGQIGSCGSGTCKGINIGNVRLSKIAVENISTAGTNVTYASTVGQSVVLDVNGNEPFLTYSIDPAAVKLVRVPMTLSGDPTSSAGSPTSPSVTGRIHDNSATFGNAVGAGAVDLQFTRNNASQVASQPGSVIIGGAFNSNGGSGSQAGIIGGTTNSANGANSFIGGGVNADDRGRASTQVFSSGAIAAHGDAEIATTVLRGTVSAHSGVVLTADMAAAGSANCVNIPNNTAYALTIDTVVIDHATPANNESWNNWTGLLTRGANAASTALTMSATPTPITNGTVTGSTLTAAADTTNGCLTLTYTGFTSGTDKQNAVARVTTVEVQ